MFRPPSSRDRTGGVPARLDRPGGEPAGGNLPLRIPPADQVLKTLKPDHPRLLADARRFAELRAQVRDRPAAQRVVQRVHGNAERILTQKPSEYEIPDGLRLLATSRRVLDRMLTLGMAYRLSGDKRFVERAWAELAAAAEFKDWNPRHFLDTAEMTAAFGIGYDWLFDAWTKDQRDQLRQAIVEKGFTPGLKVYRGKGWWSTCRHNWNQVCNGGLGIGALAIGDEEPAVASEILHSGLNSLPLAMTRVRPRRRLGGGAGLLGLRDQVQRVPSGGAADRPGHGLRPVGHPRLLAVRHDADLLHRSRGQELQLRRQRRRRHPGRPRCGGWRRGSASPATPGTPAPTVSGGPLDILWYDASLDTAGPRICRWTAISATRKW